ncbi:uncharacterized protein [Leptinotarsa decemlineata]|uniref:uncharacterized protein n=1 Tax=Leptinotarsa decemlineata TaxID=7539 RepID=UPI003D306FA2
MEELLCSLAGKEKGEIIGFISQLISALGLSQSDLLGRASPGPGDDCQSMTARKQGVAKAPTSRRKANSDRDYSDTDSVASFSSSVSKKRRFNDGFPPLPSVSRRRIDEWIRHEKVDNKQVLSKREKKLKKRAVLQSVQVEARNYYSESETSSRQVAQNQANEEAASSESAKSSHNETESVENVVEIETLDANANDGASTTGSTVKSVHGEEPTPPSSLRQDSQNKTSKARIPPIVVRQKDK